MQKNWKFVGTILATFIKLDPQLAKPKPVLFSVYLSFILV